jgi:phosphate transport system ATP-binding protein
MGGGICAAHSGPAGQYHSPLARGARVLDQPEASLILATNLPPQNFSAPTPRDSGGPHPDLPPVPKIASSQLDFFYGNYQALHGISLQIYGNRITSFIGPSGCGKSTLLRIFNRMYETVRGSHAAGQIFLDGQSIFDIEVSQLRRRVGMVFQRSNPFPKSIFENVAYGLRINGTSRTSVLSDLVEQSLKRAALWEEVKDKLNQSPYDLSGGQQQRLCIARALAVNPEILLLDEPCSALDPVATAKIEELLFALRRECTIVVVTHNMQQAARVADYTGFLLQGKLVEFNPTTAIFRTPARKETEDYITGRFG